MFVDSHCHLDLIAQQNPGKSVADSIKAAEQEQVEELLCVAVNLAGINDIKAIAAKYPQVYYSVGVHPNESVEENPLTLDSLTELASGAKVIAIGETGLDYFRSEGDLTWQRDRFRLHIQAAIACQKPLIIHTRDAAKDTIDIMRGENANKAQGVMHCFTESLAVAKAALDLDFYISFSGIVTFKNAKELQEVAQYVPLDRILIETDSPYLAPVPQRGKLNEPAYVRFVAEKLAELKQCSLEQIALTTTANYRRLFKRAVS